MLKIFGIKQDEDKQSLLSDSSFHLKQLKEFKIDCIGNNIIKLYNLNEERANYLRE